MITGVHGNRVLNAVPEATVDDVRDILIDISPEFSPNPSETASGSAGRHQEHPRPGRRETRGQSDTPYPRLA